MLHTNALYQLGRFVVMFQRIEGALTDLLVLLARADDEAVRILVNDLAFVQRVKTTTALFNRFVDLQSTPDTARKAAFAALSTDIIKLAERRNELVHSDYSAWTNIHGASGLLRSSSRLRKGEREQNEEELLAQAFEPDIERLAKISQKMEEFRRYAIWCIYPE